MGQIRKLPRAALYHIQRVKISFLPLALMQFYPVLQRHNAKSTHLPRGNESNKAKAHKQDTCCDWQCVKKQKKLQIEIQTAATAAERRQISVGVWRVSVLRAEEQRHLIVSVAKFKKTIAFEDWGWRKWRNANATNEWFQAIDIDEFNTATTTIDIDQNDKIVAICSMPMRIRSLFLMPWRVSRSS